MATTAVRMLGLGRLGPVLEFAQVREATVEAVGMEGVVGMVAAEVSFCQASLKASLPQLGGEAAAEEVMAWKAEMKATATAEMKATGTDMIEPGMMG